jgi:hypothetical protein
MAGCRSSRSGTVLLLIATAFSFDVAQAADAAISGSARILYAETLDPSVVANGMSKAGAPATLQFDAYGKRFSLTLENNTRIAPLAKQASTLHLYRGQIDGVASSWVRLATSDSGLHGLLSDGSELYAIEPATDVSDALGTGVTKSGTVIFRLSDTIVGNGTLACGSDASAPNESQPGAATYASLVNELKRSSAVMQAAGATSRLEIEVRGDSRLLARYASEQQARDELLVRMNNVDGIFSAQVGVEIQVDAVGISNASNDPFTSTTSASSLLAEVGRVRRKSLNASGLTHLFTGRDLDGATVGIAYLDSLCHSEYGVGLTEINNRGAWLESLITAHELGHNFGAPHDGDGACASTPSGTFLMSPSVSTSRSMFSQCSLGRIVPHAAAAPCVTALPPADLGVLSSLGTTRATASREFDWTLAVTNTGGAAALDSMAEIHVDAAIAIDEAVVSGGSCTFGAGVVQCQLGTIAASASQSVRLSLSGTTFGSTPIAAHVSARNETQMSNNDGTGTIAIDPEADVAVSLNGAVSATAGASFSVPFAITNLSTTATANSIELTIELPGGVTGINASMASSGCAVQGATISCSITQLAAGATVTGSTVLSAQNAGEVRLVARTTGAYLDPNAANDTSERSITVAPATAALAPSQTTSPASSESISRSGGGGGSFDLLFVLAFASLRFIRRR